MPLTMALAPNGAAAVTSSRLLPPDMPTGYTQDPYDHTHLWVGRERQDTAPSLTNTLLDQRQENWLPPGDSELKASLLPDRIITMPAGSGSMAGEDSPDAAPGRVPAGNGRRRRPAPQPQERDGGRHLPRQIAGIPDPQNQRGQGDRLNPPPHTPTVNTPKPEPIPCL